MATVGVGTDEDDLPLSTTIAAGAVAAAMVLPVLWLVRTALAVGLEAALAMVTRPTNVEVFVNSSVLVVAVTGASLLIGVPLAYLTVRTDLPFRRGWTVAASLPLVVPSYIGAFAFVSTFSRGGALTRLVGIDSLPISIYDHPFLATTLVLTLYTYPYVFITTRAALQSMDTTLIDAARSLEHTRLEAFRRVTLPHVKPAVAAGSLLVALYALSDFGTPMILGYDAFTRVIYTEFTIGSQDFAALLSLQLLGLTFLILGLESAVRGDEPIHGGQQGGRRNAISLGRWRWPATALPAAVAGLALAVPLLVLVGWLLAGGSEVASSLAFRTSYAVSSVGVAGATAVGATIAGLPVAYLAARYRSRVVEAFERASYIGYAVPGVVLGLALVYFAARNVPMLYQTLLLLVFAYVVRFLPQAVGSMRASFLRVNPALPEAARTLGRTSVGAFRDVTMPLVAPGVVGGAALVFLTTMKELPVTLLLKPSGFKTLVVHIWTVYESGHFGQAAVPALILLGVSALSMVVILRQEGYDVT